ncbi:hypothetical protein [Glutamicibacter halophytocola]|uniref:hypothetical protein n=1 Tax=Glutamicibacter halophytocola TaxID=1933880 RepID=UPI0015C56240|nr:hypothetical protein [Glutamicibacter halophytocola]NQD39959.1 hypothetical protein [Glutamicibacter halophytocola]
MGVTNFDNLPQNAVATTLREARQQAREQKGSLQQTTGNNLRYFIYESGPGMVWQGDVTGYPTFIQPSFDLTITAKHADTFLAEVCVELYGSSDGGATWTPYEYPQGVLASQANSGSFIPKQQKWRIDLYAIGYRGFKFQVLATDEVSVAITRVD